MTRYIDADVAIKKILDIRDEIPRTINGLFGKEITNHNGDLMRGGLRKALRCINDTPTADVEGVVWCVECKHRIDDEDFVSGHYCVKRPSNGGYFCDDDDFCSYWERRKDNGTSF